MLPQTNLILDAVAKALAAKAPAHPYYIRQPMLVVADALHNLKDTNNGNSHHVRRRPDGNLRP